MSDFKIAHKYPKLVNKSEINVNISKNWFVLKKMFSLALESIAEIGLISVNFEQWFNDC